MDTLDDFLGRLLREGKVLFRHPRGPSDVPPSGAAIRELERAFAIRRLEVAGPPIAFDPQTATAAGEVVRRACWALVHRGERPEGLAEGLRMPLAPRTPGHHLSADLVFRFLPQIHRRAKGMDPADPLVVGIAGLLRRWPLSGVLADLDDGPESPPDLGGHPGLMLLYAERMARRDRPNWHPAGRALEYIELVRGSGAGDGRRHG